MKNVKPLKISTIISENSFMVHTLQHTYTAIIGKITH